MAVQSKPERSTIVVLEPEASTIIDAQDDDQRRGMEALARGLQNADGYATGGRWHARPRFFTH